MKTSAIIRIIVGLLIAALLTSVLVSVIRGGKNWNWDWDGLVLHFGGFDRDDDKDDGDKAASGSGTSAGMLSPEPVNRVEASGITKLAIDWVAGDVQIAPAEAGETAIVFSETSRQSLTDAQTLRYAVSNGKLTITYCEKTTDWSWKDLNKLNMPEKDLTVSIPAALFDALKAVDVDAVSADVTMRGVSAFEISMESVSGSLDLTGATADELDLNTVSGNLTCSETTARKLEIESVSGKVEAEGAFTYVDTDSVSGNVSIRSTVCPTEVDGESVSGEIRLRIPADSAFTAKLDAASGDLSCTFPGVMQKRSITVGSGTAKFDFSTVSGDVRIEQN